MAGSCLMRFRLCMIIMCTDKLMKNVCGMAIRGIIILLMHFWTKRYLSSFVWQLSAVFSHHRPDITVLVDWLLTFTHQLWWPQDYTIIGNAELKAAFLFVFVLLLSAVSHPPEFKLFWCFSIGGFYCAWHIHFVHVIVTCFQGQCQKEKVYFPFVCRLIEHSLLIDGIFLGHFLFAPFSNTMYLADENQLLCNGYWTKIPDWLQCRIWCKWALAECCTLVSVKMGNTWTGRQ